MRKLILILVLILIAAAVLLMGGGGLESPPKNEPHPVVLTEDGFSPQVLKIKKGESVLFSTSLDANFWPASNYHPTHALYPEFDPQKPILPQGSWSFKFEKRGTWGYHDHLSPYYLGTITVE